MISSGVVVVGSGVNAGVVDGPLLKVNEVGVGAAGVVKAKVGGVGVVVAVGGLVVVANGVVVGKVNGWVVVAPPNGVVVVAGLVVVTPPNGGVGGKALIAGPANAGVDDPKGLVVVVALPNGVVNAGGVPKALLVEKALLVPKVVVVGFWPKREGVVEFCGAPKTVVWLRENGLCGIVGLIAVSEHFQ